MTEQQRIIAPPQVTEGEPNRRALASVCPRYRLWQVIWLAEKRGRRCVQGQTLRVFSLMGKIENRPQYTQPRQNFSSSRYGKNR